MSKLIVLKSFDGETLELEEAVAMKSQTINHLIDDNCANSIIPIPNVTGKILEKTFEYCKRHADAEACSNPSDEDKEGLKKFDSDFIMVDKNTLYDLIMVANYLDIKTLLDLACQTVADIIKGLEPEEIRKAFNITNDYTPEEEEFVRHDNSWAFEE